jgi:hypothetical protein
MSFSYYKFNFVEFLFLYGRYRLQIITVLEQAVFCNPSGLYIYYAADAF